MKRRTLQRRALVTASTALLVSTVVQVTPSQAAPPPTSAGGARTTVETAPASLVAIMETPTANTPATPMTSAAAPEATTRAAAATALAGQARVALSRLPLTLRMPHPGTAEAVGHPAADALRGGALPAGALQKTGGGALQKTGGSAQQQTGGSAAGISEAASAKQGILGVDVAAYQGSVPWTTLASHKLRFAYMKATEGTYYVDSTYFPNQYNGSYNAGLVRGAYHFAIPNNSSGAAQADYFVANGGGWSADGHTLPGMLDLEYNPYGAECYGLTHGQMIRWVASFDNEYKRLTGRMPEMYTSASWWNYCTGRSSVGAVDPLSVANWGASPDPLPASWTSYRIWQFTDSDSFGVDGDVFDGNHALLVAFARGRARSGTGG